jgi:hypothetical protein
MKKTLFFLLLCLNAAMVCGQENPVVIEDVVRLNDGSIYRGKIVESVPGNYTLLQIHDSVRIRLETRIVNRVWQKRYGGPTEVHDHTYHFRERGLYNATSLGFLPGFEAQSIYYIDYYPGGGQTSSQKFVLGITASHSIGYQFNRLLGAGGGIGFDYNGGSYYLPVMPLYLDVRGYLLPSYFSPYYNLMLGYGVAFKNNSGYSDIQSTQGGLFFSPNIGIRMGGKSGTNWFLDCGLRFQSVSYDVSNSYVYDHRAIKYCRYSIRTGIMF